eukprot:1272-Eustigmatos_ZCMA.PRE.1
MPLVVVWWEEPVGYDRHTLITGKHGHHEEHAHGHNASGAVHTQSNNVAFTSVGLFIDTRPVTMQILRLPRPMPHS